METIVEILERLRKGERTIELRLDVEYVQPIFEGESWSQVTKPYSERLKEWLRDKDRKSTKESSHKTRKR